MSFLGSLFGGSPAGSSGSGTGKSANVYTPQAQPQADIAYQGIVQNLFPYANDPSTTPAGQAYSTLNPYGQQLANQGLINQGMQGAQNAYTNYQALYPAAQNLGQLIPGGAINSYIQAQQNPYNNQALQGALTGAGYAGPGAGAAASGGALMSGAAPDVYTQGSNTLAAIYGLIPQVQQLGTQGQQYLQGLAPGALATGGATQKAIQDAMTPLQGLSSQILGTAFDPQQALYNRTQQQVTDQARAAAAASGMAGTPYGTGVENQALSNFNIDWQNNQLARQTQGAQAGTAIQNAIAQMIGQGGTAAQQGTQLAGGLFGTGTGIGQQGLTSAGNLYGQGMNALTGGAGAAGQMFGTGLDLSKGAAGLAASGGALPSQQYYGNLQSGTAVQNAIAQLASQGLNIGTQGAQGLSTFAGQPYASLGQAINNILTPGLGNIAQLGQQQFQLPQQVLNDLQSYLGLGQSASQLSGYLGNLGLQQTSNALGGLGSALSGANNLLFGGGGGGGGGLLGGLSSLIGGGAGAAGADVTGLLSPAASAAFPAFDATTQALLSGGGAAASSGGILGTIGDAIGALFL